MDFIKRNIVFIGVVLGTLALIVGGVLLFSRGGSQSGTQVNSALLEPAGKQKTGGIVNGAYVAASPDSKVSLVEFGDYECPACGAYNPLVKQVLTQFAGKITFAFKNFPLSQHANAPISSYAAEAAGFQGKFWQMHDKLYENQNEWSTATDAKTIFVGYAKDIGINVTQFSSDIDSQKVKDIVQSDLGDGNTIGINATPTFYVNGIKIDNPTSLNGFAKIIQDAIDKAPIAQGTGAPSYHIHFDLKTYINGTAINFAQSKYQESKTNPLDENIHFHDGNGDIVHVHNTGIPLSELFSSLKITFPANTTTSNLKVYVNGNINSQGLSYIPQDTDQILVSYGPIGDVSIQKQISSITNNSCIYSLKCPNRGTPPPEDCIGGLGTGCTD